MPEKTSTSSPSSRRRCSEARARLVCPADLPVVSLSVAPCCAAAQPRHAHDSLILGLVTAGARRIATAAESVLVQTGEVFVLKPGLAHSCAPEDGPCSYLAFSLGAAALPEGVGLRLPVQLVDHRLAEALERLAEALEAPVGPLERQSLLAEVLELLAAHALPQEKSAPEGDSRLGAAVRQAQALLEADLEPGLGLPELAQACGAEMYALHRAFTRETGLPPHAYQTHLRLRRAKELLRAGASLAEAALESGFCDQSHMNRHFARLVGQTPAQYAGAFAPKRP